MKKIDIFIDLENIGVAQAASTEGRNIRYIGERLRVALARIEYEPQKIMAFASYGISSLRRHRSALRKKWPADKLFISQHKQDRISQTCAQFGWEMVWHRGSADRSLQITVGTYLQNGLLEKHVMLMTNDQDFLELVQDVKASGRKVIVCGQCVSKKLIEVSDRNFNLWKFLKGPVQPAFLQNFNPIPL